MNQDPVAAPESKVAQEEATARLKQLDVVAAELELLKKLEDAGVALRRDEKGNLTVFPRRTYRPDLKGDSKSLTEHTEDVGPHSSET